MPWVVPQSFRPSKTDFASHYAYSFQNLYHIDFSKNRNDINAVNHFEINRSIGNDSYILGDDYHWKRISYLAENNREMTKSAYYALQIHHKENSDNVSLCHSLTPAGCVYIMILLINTDDSKCILNLNDRDIVKSIREMDALWIDQFTSYTDVPEAYRINKLQEPDYDALKAEAKKHDGKVEGVKELCVKQLLLDITGRE